MLHNFDDLGYGSKNQVEVWKAATNAISTDAHDL